MGVFWFFLGGGFVFKRTDTFNRTESILACVILALVRVIRMISAINVTLG